MILAYGQSSNFDGEKISKLYHEAKSHYIFVEEPIYASLIYSFGIHSQFELMWDWFYRMSNNNKKENNENNNNNNNNSSTIANGDGIGNATGWKPGVKSYISLILVFAYHGMLQDCLKMLALLHQEYSSYKETFPVAIDVVSGVFVAHHSRKNRNNNNNSNSNSTSNGWKQDEQTKTTSKGIANSLLTLEKTVATLRTEGVPFPQPLYSQLKREIESFPLGLTVRFHFEGSTRDRKIDEIDELDS